MENTTKKDDLTIEKLTSLLTAYIKEKSKTLSIDKVPTYSIEPFYGDWVNGAKEWTKSEIRFNGNKYEFYKTHITNEMYLSIMENAFAKSKCLGKIEIKEYDEYIGWHTIHHKSFNSLTLYVKPCEEFNKLNKMLDKYCGKTIQPTEVYNVNLFGKRGRYGESGDKFFLCHNSKKCQRLIDFIKTHKTSRDKLSFEIVTDDDIDTSYSVRYETECYGARYISVKLKVETPNGKVKAVA